MVVLGKYQLRLHIQ